jgi:phosphotriesterase-related protein
MTVLGPVEPGDLGPTLTHEHLLISLFDIPGRWDLNGLLHDRDLIADEIGHFRDAGGGTIVELSLPGSGRDPEGLRHLAEKSGLHVVMGCGWYRQPYYRPEDRIDRRSVEDLAGELVAEIENGCVGTGIRPGIIGEIGCDKTWMSALEERAHRAAARAQLATGLPLTTHSIASPIGLWQLDIFEQEGVDPRRVVIGHADSYPVLDYCLAIVRRGAYVQFDKVGNQDAFFTREDRLVRLILDLIDQGFIAQILLSQDICFRSELKTYGGRGYDYIPTRFVPTLQTAGLGDHEIRQLLEVNPQRMLSQR